MQRPTIIATDDTIHQIVREEIAKYGNAADLNHIDVSNVTNMRLLFSDAIFNGDISQWNVSNVTNMANMFYISSFNGDISQWNVSNVTDMSYMFSHSKFNCSLSQWNVSNVTNMEGVFKNSSFNGDLSQWNVSKVDNMMSIFERSQFNGDLSNWVLHQGCNVRRMINGLESPIAPPLLCVDSIESYQNRLASMIEEPERWWSIIIKNTGAITAHHGVALLLLHNSAPGMIHPELTKEDLQKLEMFYQLTGSVYQSSKTWMIQRKNAITTIDTSLMDRLCDER
jgi:surface protein